MHPRLSAAPLPPTSRQPSAPASPPSPERSACVSRATAMPHGTNRSAVMSRSSSPVHDGGSSDARPLPASRHQTTHTRAETSRKPPRNAENVPAFWTIRRGTIPTEAPGSSLCQRSFRSLVPIVAMPDRQESGPCSHAGAGGAGIMRSGPRNRPRVRAPSPSGNPTHDKRQPSDHGHPHASQRTGR